VNSTIDVSLDDTGHTLDGFIKIQYSNHSPDTLSFIWFHVWPNAYKNDGTAFSEQLLGNGRTDFYFSPKERKGYINHLDFRVDGLLAIMQDHPRYIDVIKVLLPRPLPPGEQCTITTPFHEQLPFNFSRGGRRGGGYQVTQWYPKPAVYDQRGWHEMPYLDQGEFYSEYGNFDVRITLPAGYTVAATGILQHEDSSSQIPKSQISQSLHYIQANVHDFAWFASRHFQTDHDTLQLASGRIIDVYATYTPESAPIWKNSIQMIKNAVRFRSSLIGEYPFSVVSAVEAKIGTGGGMEYPTITAIAPRETSSDLDKVIGHEVGHNWFYAALGSNERRYPWMDEGINTYYDLRYAAASSHPSPLTTHHSPLTPKTSKSQNLKIPKSQHPAPRTPKIQKSQNLNISISQYLTPPPSLLINSLAKVKMDQPISTASEDFTKDNYGLIAYHKTALWMQQMESTLGTKLFDSCMQAYFRDWQYKHPYPEDFRRVVEATSGRRLDSLFALLDEKGPLHPFLMHKTIRPSLSLTMRNTEKIDYINIFPAIGANKADGLMPGLLIHNYNLPASRLQFVLAPLYATRSARFNGIGRVSYSWYPDDRFRKISLALGGARFSTLSGIDSNGNRLSGGFYKVTPSLRLILKNRTARSTLENWIEWKTFLIREKGFDNYVRKSTDSLFYPTEGKYAFRYLNQLSFATEDTRVLYPYSALLQVQQASRFYRINLTGNYFFNYAQGGGMDLRFFAAKFGYLGGRSSGLDLTVYQPKLTAVRGNEDYTYSNYFVGRNEFTGFASQQIMMRDGGLKLRTDLFQGIQGRSDNWIAALNFNSTLPSNLVPSWLPLKIFLDIGTYADAWHSNAPTSKFLYVGGLQLSLFHNLVNFYAPLFYSSDFSSSLKTVPEENTFLKKCSFSIDIQYLRSRKLLGNIPF